MDDRFTPETSADWNRVLADWRNELERELREILSFWMGRLVDRERGGFYGRMDGRGRLYPDADKGIILNSRLLWTFAAAARETGEEEYAVVARHAYGYLHRHFRDKAHGGVFWMLNADGRPVNTRKQVYAQAFAIYALAEYFLLTKEEDSLAWAFDLFQLLERHSRDSQRGGYLEAFQRDWTPIEDLRLSEKDANEAKTMNTHLHVLEAYTNLYRATAAPEVGEALGALIWVFLDRFIDPATGHLHLFFNEDWQLKSKTISFGHDIECSWLLWEAAETLGDAPLLGRVATASLKLARATAREGLDANGALMNEMEPDVKLDADRHWWPQAEAMVGFMEAYQTHRHDQWLRYALNIWRFIQKHHKDPSTGEWHWRVDAQGKVRREEDLAGPWKAPYHNARACMELIRRIDGVTHAVAGRHPGEGG